MTRPMPIELEPLRERMADGPMAANPHQLGRPLVGELEGLQSARRGDYRIIYEVFEDDQVVLIHRV